MKSRHQTSQTRTSKTVALNVPKALNETEKKKKLNETGNQEKDTQTKLEYQQREIIQRNQTNF